MWKSIKYILIFFACEIVLAFPVVLMNSVLHLGKGMIVMLILGFGNLFAGLYIFLKAKLSFKTDFAVGGLGKIILLCTIASLFLILPISALSDCLELPDKLEDLETDMCSYLGIFVVGIIGPVGEELLFRGAVLRSLLDWERIRDRRWLAVVISAFLFSLIHFNPAQMPGAFVIGLVYGWVALETGSLVPSIVMHIVNNLSVCVLGRMAEQELLSEDYVLFGSQILENVVITLSAILFVLCLYVLNKQFVQRNYPEQKRFHLKINGHFLRFS